jgi:hypothetical protein
MKNGESVIINGESSENIEMKAGNIMNNGNAWRNNESYGVI